MALNWENTQNDAFPQYIFFSGFPQVSMCICTYKVTTSLSECQETRFCVVSSPAGQKTGNLDSTLGVKQSQGIYPGGIVSLQLVCNYAHVKCYHHHLYYHYYYLYCNLYLVPFVWMARRIFKAASSSLEPVSTVFKLLKSTSDRWKHRRMSGRKQCHMLWVFNWCWDAFPGTAKLVCYRSTFSVGGEWWSKSLLSYLGSNISFKDIIGRCEGGVWYRVTMEMSFNYFVNFWKISSIKLKAKWQVEWRTWRCWLLVDLKHEWKKLLYM